MRILKFILGAALLPTCLAVTLSLADLIRAIQSPQEGAWSPSLWGLVIGFLLWLFLYWVMPRPARAYVLAHELTHILWAWMMGARIKGIHVSRRGGHVKISHTNFIITLAPYFFPFYTICVILLYLGLSIFLDMNGYEPVWLGWIGLTWSFHLTFTLSALAQKQPDIQEHGRLFSYSLIYLLNVIGVCIGIIAVTDVTWEQWSGDFLSAAAHAYTWIYTAIRQTWAG